MKHISENIIYVLLDLAVFYKVILKNFENSTLFLIKNIENQNFNNFFYLLRKAAISISKTPRSIMTSAKLNIAKSNPQCQ